ncbi:anti-sigma factor [Croceiramulus getboli]|nr:anti-sigma factor [Flavobacteriaceae bacterium YJPT1-3]
MENLQEYIDSGILELYVYGALTAEESEAVSNQLLQYPEVRQEVEEIESALQQLSAATAPYQAEAVLAAIKEKLGEHEPKVVPIDRKRGFSSVVTYISWAACLALIAGIFALLTKNNELKDDLQYVEAQNALLETKIEDARNDIERTEELLAVYRDRSITKVPLAGQQVAPEAYVDVFWDKENNRAYFDAQGLPEPPPGKVYQVWSLKLNPLTPTSLGLLEDFASDENKIFVLENPNDSEAFGITLEPEGGSESPTLEQLYTLGVAETS